MGEGQNIQHSFQVSPQVSDLDAQMHVNNAAYERFAQEARFEIFKSLGFSYGDFLQQNLYLRPLAATVKFLKQQIVPVTLTIETQWRMDAGGRCFWDHRIVNQQNGEPAAVMTYFHQLEKDGRPWAPPLSYSQIPALPQRHEFSESCRRAKFSPLVRHIEIDGFQKIPPWVIWRYNEEGRWNFVDTIGLSFDAMKQSDTALFWVEGEYVYGEELRHHDELDIYTWIESSEGARIYFRQEGIIQSSKKMAMSLYAEFVTVSIKRSRAVRAPQFLIEAMEPFTEK